MSLLVFAVPPVVGGDDSTVGGFSEWSPTGGERVGGCLQSECVSEKQGTCYRMHPPNYTLFVTKNFPYKHAYDPTLTQTQHTQTHTIAATFGCM